MRVLLAEDSDATAEVVAKVLASAGHEVRRVASAEGALAELALSEFDALVLDMMLAGSDGARVLREARELPRRIVVATGVAPDELQGVPHGASVLRKPYEFDQLLAAVEGR